LATLLLTSTDPPREGDPAALGQQCAEMLATARAQWPAIPLEDADYVLHLASLLPAQCDVGEALAAMEAADVYLACACCLGVASAVSTFDAALVAPCRAVVAGASDVIDRDEFLQRLRERLLVAPKGKRSRLAAFSGRGKLVNWVRIAAQRLLIDEYRKRETGAAVVPEDEAAGSLRAAGVDPEIGVIKGTYREGFQAAFEAAFSKLTVRERTLLRYRYVDGLEVNQVAAVAGLHRVTVYRALLKARESLLEHLRRGLAEQMHVGGSQAESMFRLMQSQLDVRMSRLFDRDTDSDTKTKA